MLLSGYRLVRCEAWMRLARVGVGVRGEWEGGRWPG